VRGEVRKKNGVRRYSEFAGGKYGTAAPKLGKFTHGGILLNKKAPVSAGAEFCLVVKGDWQATALFYFPTYASAMAPMGQTPAQVPQEMHSSALIS
jgi:hypothetical protein